MKKIKLLTPINGDFVFYFIIICLCISLVGLWFLGKPFIFVVYLLLLRIVFQFIVKIRIKPGDIVLFFGLPGSGKTLSLSKVGLDSAKARTGLALFSSKFRPSRSFKHIAVNDSFVCFDGATTYFNRKLLTRHCWHDTLFLYDEASLDGFDNRNFATNFKDENLLRKFKKVRHNDNAFVFANQGANELDCKIRDSLCNKVFYCENYGSYSIASRLIKDVSVSNESGAIQEGYRKPTLFERILHPRYTVILLHKKYGAHYSTKMPDYNQTEAPYDDLDIKNYR